MTEIENFEKIIQIYANTLPLTKFHINMFSFEGNITFLICNDFYPICIFVLQHLAIFTVSTSTSLGKMSVKKKIVDRLG